MKRLKGFVVGSQTNPTTKSQVWSVRVKDKESPYDGAKFKVGSTHADIALTRGLNVTFILGTIDDENGQKVTKAIDVMVDTA